MKYILNGIKNGNILVTDINPSQRHISETHIVYYLRNKGMILQYYGHLMWKVNSLETNLVLGKTEGWRRRWWQRMGLLDDIINSVNMSLSKLRVSERQVSLGCFSPWFCKESDVTEWLNNKGDDAHICIHVYLCIYI